MVRPGVLGGGEEGGGGGAGGFCAAPTGTKNPIASPSLANMRVRRFIVLFLRWELLCRNCSSPHGSSQGFLSEQSARSVFDYGQLPFVAQSSVGIYRDPNGDGGLRFPFCCRECATLRDLE